MRYSGMAFELLALMIIMVFVGKKLDEFFEMKKSVFTAFLVIFGVIGYLVKLYYEIKNEKKNDR